MALVLLSVPFCQWRVLSKYNIFTCQGWNLTDLHCGSQKPVVRITPSVPAYSNNFLYAESDF